jgi:SOS response regulatory protein OraA/RecX
MQLRNQLAPDGFSTDITVDVIASVKTAGLIGDKYINKTFTGRLGRYP